MVMSGPMGRTMEDAERAIRQLRIDGRAMQEDAEVAVAELARATRTLRDAILDLARSGAQLRVELVGTTFAGRVVHVGDDVVRIARADRPLVDIAVSAISGVHSLPGSAGPATVSSGYPATLVARCRELVQASAGVEVGRRGLSSVAGQLMAATPTHVELAAVNGGTSLIPFAEIGWVERVDR